jgi:hypothetical protein
MRTKMGANSYIGIACYFNDVIHRGAAFLLRILSR